MSPIRIGVLGFGLRSSLAIDAHENTGGLSRVVAVCDPSERGRSDARSRLGAEVRIVESIEALLAQDLDAVLVLTPDYLHEEHAITMLEAGIPTFLEKPMAITTEGADRVLACARRTGTRLYVGHNMRHMPVIRAMRQAILDGRIGEVKAVWCRHFVSPGGDFYFKDWHADRTKTTGLLLQKGAHDIDVIHWLAGGYSRTVTALGSLAVYGRINSTRDNSDRRMWDWYNKDVWPPARQRDLNNVVNVEDLSMAMMELDNGVLASYQQCHFSPDYWRSYTVIGTEGRLENFGNDAEAIIKVWNKRSDTYNEAPDLVVPIPPAAGGHGGADPALITEFVRFAAGGGLTETSPLAAREAVAAAVAATASLRSGGGAQHVAPPDERVRAWFDSGQIDQRMP